MALWRKVRPAILALCPVLVILLAVEGCADGGEAYPEIDERTFNLNASYRMQSSVSYLDLLRATPPYEQDGFGSEVAEVSAANYAAASEEARVARARMPGKPDDALQWRSGAGFVEWLVDVPRDGWYEIAVEYYPLAGSYASIVRGVQIDGAYPFAEAETVELPRHWQDGKRPYDRNPLGDEMRPMQQELPEWTELRLGNFHVSSEPFRVQLSAGRHTLRLIGHREPVALYKIKLIPYTALPSYAEYADSAPAGPDAAALPVWSRLFEAERFDRKSSTAIQTSSVSEPYVSPGTGGRVVYNSLGGEYWKSAGHWVEWEIEVPYDGRYAIDLKYFQGYNGHSAAYRTVMIDGQVPFREMLHYRLPSTRQFQIHTFGDERGEPYLFYLKRGAHTVRMVADASPVYPAETALVRTMQEMFLLERDIRAITGNYGTGSTLNLDLSRTWDMERDYPGIADKIGGMANNLEAVSAYLNGLNRRRTDATTAIAVAVHTLRDMQRHVDDIPNRVNDFAVMQASLSTWTAKLSEQKVLLDYAVVRTPHTSLELKVPTFWSRAGYAVLGFVRSFALTYDLQEMNDDEAITVWIQRGRDYADMLREMIDREFTPSTGIKVNLNLMPNPNALILGNAAGNHPDVALGIAAEMVGDYAMRGAIADLSRFAGYAEAAERFHPGAMRPLTVNGGVYGVPETQNFVALFYRSDLLESLGLVPPDTWADVYRMLPTLQENGMSFYYPAPNAEFNMLFYQHGAEFYSPDGLSAKLDGDEALEAFAHWTDLFAKYNLPREVPVFLNHFRAGDMPIGIADFNMYVQLQTAAPEITGRWAIAVLPGVTGTDGTVRRWAPQTVSSGVVMRNSDKQEAAWTFLDWWTSTDVQTRYGSGMESLYGVEYRWNSANLQALFSLPYPDRDLRVIKEQARWIKNVPLVPGYYYLTREMTFAWTRTVLERMPPKESLMRADTALQREMDRKQADLGIPPSANLQVAPYEIPYDIGGLP